MMAFCPELAYEQALCLGKKDQNPKFTPLSETTSFPTPFICGVPPPPGQHMFLSRTIAAIDQAGKCCLNEPQRSIIGVVYLVSETEHL